ncbi:MAG: EAL domain-containing protein, partial [Lachnospiraceae bacterium]|nr:EAL domain-containing protein [Lachnospiraceae bacterium]
IYFFKSCGIKTALDGSCLTSLNLIRELPVDMIKVDRDMIANIEKNPTDQYMLEAVTGFARKMHIDVCVEGVETESTRNFLKRFPVSVYQGYYYSEPVRLQELKTLPLFRIAAV